jgi:hypothetical protein
MPFFITNRSLCSDIVGSSSVLKIVGIQGQSSKNPDFYKFSFKIAPEFLLFSTHKDPTVSLVAYKPLKKKLFRNPQKSSHGNIISHGLQKTQKQIFFYSGQISEKINKKLGAKKNIGKNK